LIQDILALDRNKIFIEGILNQDPGGKKDPIIQLTHKGQTLKPVNLAAILPKNLKSAGRNWFKSTFMYNMVMIHSKVIVIDPLGSKPVVMTGSHYGTQGEPVERRQSCNYRGRVRARRGIRGVYHERIRAL
jgi:hypothetical protein